LEIYLSSGEEIVEWANHLETFAHHQSELIVDNLWSIQRENQQSRVQIRIEDIAGSCAIALTTKDRPFPADKQTAEVSIRAEVWQLAELGRLMRVLSGLEHEVLEWCASGGVLYRKRSDSPPRGRIWLASDDQERIASDAAMFRVALETGFVSASEVIDWSADVIGSLDDPPIAVFDLLALNGDDIQGVLHQLNDICSAFDSQLMLPFVLGAYADRLEAHPELATRVARGIRNTCGDWQEEWYLLAPKELQDTARFDDSGTGPVPSAESLLHRRLVELCQRLRPSNGSSR
jgi:hypothetical protein